MDAARLIPPELAGAVRLGWVPEPVRYIALPAAIEELFGGGLPRGRVCEVVGARGSGRTSLIYSLLAAATAASEFTAVVDAADTFDPASASRASIDLSAVLWVRPPSVRDALRCAELILAAGGFGLAALDLDSVPLRRLRFHSWPRLARAAEKAGTSLVILAPAPLVGSFAAMSVKMKALRAMYRMTVAGRRSPVAGQRRTEDCGLRTESESSTEFKVLSSKFSSPTQHSVLSTQYSALTTTLSPQSSSLSPVLSPQSPVPSPHSSSVLSPVSLGPPLFEGLESYGILVHNKRGPLRASRRLRWTMWTSPADIGTAAVTPQLKIQNSKFKTREA